MKKEKAIKQLLFMSGGGGGVTYETPSYLHALGSGTRAALNGKITTSGATMWGFVNTDPNYLVDGNKVADNIYPNNAIDVADEWLMIDFTEQASSTYTADKINFIYGGTANGGVWKIQAYIGTAWVDVSANYTMYDANPQEIALTGAEGFTKLRQLGVSGTSAWQYFREIEFSIGGEA